MKIVRLVYGFFDLQGERVQLFRCLETGESVDMGSFKLDIEEGKKVLDELQAICIPVDRKAYAVAYSVAQSNEFVTSGVFYTKEHAEGITDAARGWFFGESAEKEIWEYINDYDEGRLQNACEFETFFDTLGTQGEENIVVAIAEVPMEVTEKYNSKETRKALLVPVLEFLNEARMRFTKK